jgi:hypothetical protein
VCRDRHITRFYSPPSRTKRYSSSSLLILSTRRIGYSNNNNPSHNNSLWLSLLSFLSSAPLWRLPTRLDKTTVTRIRLLNALHPPLAYAPDIISHFLLLRHSINPNFPPVGILLASLQAGLPLVLYLSLTRKQILCVDLSGMVIKLFVGKVL